MLAQTIIAGTGLYCNAGGYGDIAGLRLGEPAPAPGTICLGSAQETPTKRSGSWLAGSDGLPKRLGTSLRCQRLPAGGLPG
jgi:hypothetical protein